MAPAPGIMGFLRSAVKKTAKLVEKRIVEAAQRGALREPIPILVRDTPRHPISKAAWLRQSKGRWYTTHSTINANLRRFFHSTTQCAAQATRTTRGSYPTSTIGSAARASTLRAPFATTLRPNLAGGALPRTAGGYTLGGGRAGGARYFSHTPTAPAQVMHNVSAAMRCFFLSGSKARYSGVNSRGEKQYRTVSPLQDQAASKMGKSPKLAPGAFVDFKLNPTVTALSPLDAVVQSGVESASLNAEGFMDVLAVDFARALKDYTAIMNDLRRLQTLGDLTITHESGSVLRVRFPGCDADTVEALCVEIGVTRGEVGQDADFNTSYGQEIALRFPFASMSEKCLSSPGGSLRSQTGYSDTQSEEFEDEMYFDAGKSPWLDLSSPEGYGTGDEDEAMIDEFETPPRVRSLADDDSRYMKNMSRYLETSHGSCMTAFSRG